MQCWLLIGSREMNHWHADTCTGLNDHKKKELKKYKRNFHLRNKGTWLKGKIKIKIVTK